MFDFVACKTVALKRSSSNCVLERVACLCFPLLFKSMDLQEVITKMVYTIKPCPYLLLGKDEGVEEYDSAAITSACERLWIILNVTVLNIVTGFNISKGEHASAESSIDPPLRTPCFGCPSSHKA